MTDHDAPPPPAPLPRETLDGWRAAQARTVFIRDLELVARIGVHPHERAAPQPIRLTLTLQVAGDAPPAAERLPFAPPPRPDDPAARRVVCYESLSGMIRDLIAAGHIDYVETLAERVAAGCLADPRILEATVAIEKPRAIADADAAGVALTRRR